MALSPIYSWQRRKGVAPVECAACGVVFERESANRKRCLPCAIDHRGSGRKWRAVRDSVVERDEYTCAYCGYFVGEHAEIDHVMPKALGGLDTPDNLVCACHKCNIWKSDKYPTEFLLELGYQPVHNPTLLRCLDLERLERGITSVTIT